jgi:thioredoxin 1
MPSSTEQGLVTAVTDATFDEEVLRSERPVLVDFWAQWCGPCHMIAPILADLASERHGELDIRKLNYDENPKIGARYGVLSLPTMMVFRGGEPILTLVGARPKHRLIAELDKALSA